MKNTISNNLFDELLKELKVRKQQIEQEESDGDVTVLVCGDTGAGKSTTINYLLGRELLAKERENSYQLVIECKNPVSEIGHQNISTTSVPKKYKLDKLSYWDCPGFEDTAGESIDIINAYAISRIQHKSKKLKILALIEEHNLLSPLRGSVFRELIVKLTKMFDHNNESSLADSITLCFTKSGQITEYKGFILDMLEEIKPGGIQMDQKSKGLLRLIIEKERFVTFLQPEEIAPIPLLDKENIIQKISNSAFLENTEIIPVVSSKTQEFFEKRAMVYFNRKIEKDMSLIFDRICEYMSSLQKNDFKNFAKGFSDMFVKNYHKESLIITQLKLLSKKIDLSKEFEDIEFLISEVFEFLSYKILGKSNTNNDIINKTVGMLSEKIKEEFKKKNMITELNLFEKDINQDKTDFKEDEERMKKSVPVTSEENNKCCTSCNIFTVTDIKYDNELLNHPKILSQSLNKYSLSKILDLSVNIDPQLINNAIDSSHGELLLAGLISVDESVIY